LVIRGDVHIDNCIPILAELYGPRFHHDRHTLKLIDDFRDEHKQSRSFIHFHVFHRFCSEHLEIFNRIFILQYDTQRKICGTIFWRKLRFKRLERFGTHTIRIKDLVKMSTMSEVRVINHKIMFEEEQHVHQHHRPGASHWHVPDSHSHSLGLVSPSPSDRSAASRPVDDVARVESITIEGESYVIKRLKDNSLVFTPDSRPGAKSKNRSIAVGRNANVTPQPMLQLKSTTKNILSNLNVNDLISQHKQVFRDQKVYPSLIRGFDGPQRGNVYRTSSLKNRKKTVSEASGWGWP